MSSVVASMLDPVRVVMASPQSVRGSQLTKTRTPG
jgi:hypothetical protein